MIKAKVFSDTKCILGEGSWFDGRNEKLYWLDIFGCKIFVHDFKSGEQKEYPVSQMVTTIVPREDGTGFILGMRDGVYMTDNSFSQFKEIPLPADANFEARRCNDGKCAPDGKFWIGLMDMKGALGGGDQYVVGDDAVYKEMSGLDTPNGIVWNKAQDTMYFNDTKKALIYAYDYVPGHVSNQRVVYSAGPGVYTDGMAIDEDDNVWVCLHGGSRVIKIDPREGKLMDYIDVPCPQPTSIALGNGKAYITTAAVGLSDEKLEKYPDSGCLFVADIGVNGAESFRYRG